MEYQLQSLPPPPRPPLRRGGTRARQRETTRYALIDATIDVLAEEGYAALTTRRIAERAGVAQSTLMHHFETREALIVEAIPRIASQLASEALEQIDLAALRDPRHREAVLDAAWREFTSQRALAAAALWAGAWSEPEFATTLRELELHLNSIISSTAGALFPFDRGFLALIDASIALIRGLVMAIPVSGRSEIEDRWAKVKPLILNATSDLLDS